MPDIEKVTRKITKRPDQIGGGKPGPGRKPGIPNKANGLLKDAIIQAAEEAGGREGIVGYLKAGQETSRRVPRPDRSRPAAPGAGPRSERKDHRRDRTPRSG